MASARSRCAGSAAATAGAPSILMNVRRSAMTAHANGGGWPWRVRETTAGWPPASTPGAPPRRRLFAAASRRRRRGYGMVDHRGGMPITDDGTDGVIRFAALGDSLTLGIGDPMPDGRWRGWAALLAASLRPPDGVRLYNVAASGARITDVAGSQLAGALRVRPHLASVVAGVND